MAERGFPAVAGKTGWCFAAVARPTGRDLPAVAGKAGCCYADVAPLAKGVFLQVQGNRELLRYSCSCNRGVSPPVAKEVERCCNAVVSVAEGRFPAVAWEIQ
jgi:hypothetical protein